MSFTDFQVLTGKRPCGLSRRQEHRGRRPPPPVGLRSLPVTLPSRLRNKPWKPAATRSCVVPHAAETLMDNAGQGPS